MKRLLLFALALATCLSAQQQTVIRAGRLHVGDGRVLENTRVRIQDGRIIAVEKDQGPLPTGVKLLDLRKQTLIPGLVATHTSLAALDQAPNVSPDVIAADQFDFYKKYPRLVASGLTTVYLAPGKARLVPGQGSVVKLAGKNPGTRLLKEGSALHFNLLPASRRSIPAIFEPTPEPTSDDPLKAARRQRGATRHSQIAVLERVFDEARDAERTEGGEGKRAYDLTALRSVMRRELPIRLAAWTAADLATGLDLVRELGGTAIVEQLAQPLPLASRLAKEGVAAVLQMPLEPARAERGDWRRGDERTPRPTPDAPGKLANAGVRVAIVPPTDNDLDKLRLLAGLACRWGMQDKDALAAVTAEAARILGVADRVGSIEVGKDADFVALSGPPFDARSLVERVIVDGSTVFKRERPSVPFAIRAKRILVGDGTAHHDAMIVVANGKIVDVGAHAYVPAGSDIVDAGDAVIVPGFVAAASKLGLHGDTKARFATATTVDVAGALDYDDPAFRHALKAGVTTLFVTPGDQGLVGPRVCAVKTHGNKDNFVVRSVTALRLTLSAGGDAGKKQLLGAIKKARDYITPPKTAVKKPTPKPTATKEDLDPITGSWEGTVSGGPLPTPSPFDCEMKLEGDTVNATLVTQAIPVPITFKGTWDKAKKELAMKGDTPLGEITCNGTLVGVTLSGTIASAQGTLQFTMTRASAAVAKKATKKDETKKKNEALEPWRPVLAGDAPVVVRVSSDTAALAAIAAVAVESKLKLVLAGSPLMLVQKGVRPPKGTPVGFLIATNEVLHESKGKKRNLAQELAQLGFEVVLVTRAQLGTRYLPVHAAWAVATGFDARRALQAITGTPATCFGLGDRIGRLVEGADADFVLMSSDPFDLRSRILGVWVDGVRHVDNENKEGR